MVLELAMQMALRLHSAEVLVMILSLVLEQVRVLLMKMFDSLLQFLDLDTLVLNHHVVVVEGNVLLNSLEIILTQLLLSSLLLLFEFADERV